MRPAQLIKNYILKVSLALGGALLIFILYLSYCYYYFSAPSKDLYLAISPTQGVLDYDLFDKNIENVIGPLSRADVIFLGTSRTQFGFNREVLSSFFKEHNSSFFVLGFGKGTANFALHLFNKYHIKPRLVVVPSDSEFFEPAVNNYHNDSVERTYMVSLMRILYARMLISMHVISHGFCRSVDSLVFDKELPSKKFIFRYRNDGSYELYSYGEKQWKANPPHDKLRPIIYKSRGCVISPDEFDEAQKIIDGFMRSGAGVVLTTVPYQGFCPGKAKIIGDKLGVTHIEVSAESLFTFDNSHLDQTSAKRFTNLFIDEFGRSKPFREMHRLNSTSQNIQ